MLRRSPRGGTCATLGGVSALEPARIAPGGFRELGPVNWAIAKLGARAIRRRGSP
ncbi:carboxymuconolactone decarboxylase [Mycolicibacterium conceptionense]|uniref:Carboxymuconolactone decarboxylase n=1 Tax=Mycolicibacterium conceptionense TaxID=451644 RepID=A0A0U1D6U3_9MYCO|nr:carboxymuconolactone decarboxylase [Mycolicibacterium conceptionense]